MLFCRWCGKDLKYIDNVGSIVHATTGKRQCYQDGPRGTPAVERWQEVIV